MWGSDYPHSEGTYPFTTEALRVAFADYAEPDVRAVTGSSSTFSADLEVLVGGGIGLVSTSSLTHGGHPDDC